MAGCVSFGTPDGAASVLRGTAASERPEAHGPPSSTMTTYGRRTSSRASCRPPARPAAAGSTRVTYTWTSDCDSSAAARHCHPSTSLAMLSSHNTLPSGASNVMVRTELLTAVGDFDPSLQRTEDWDMWLRLARIGLPAWVPRPLVAYRHHHGNAGTNPSPMVTEPKLLAHRYGIAIDVPRMMRRAAWTCLQDGRRLKAAGYYLRSVAHGDMRSLGRAAVAMTHPAVGTPEVYRLIGWTAEARLWAAGAESWLAPLRNRNRRAVLRRPARPSSVAWPGSVDVVALSALTECRTSARQRR